MFPGCGILVPVLYLYVVSFVLYMLLCFISMYSSCFCILLFTFAGFIIGIWLINQHVNQHLIYYYYYYHYSLLPLRRVFKNKQRNPQYLYFAAILLSQSWHMYCCFRCYMFCNFTFIISDVYV